MNLKKAAIINAAGKYSQVILSMFVSAVLARILSPEDYGIVAVVTVFSTFFATLSNMGFCAAIIQKKDLTDEEIDYIFSFTVYVAVGLMILFAACAYPIAAFYNNRVYISLSIMLSVALLFNAMNMVPTGLLNKEKRFVTIAVRTVTIYLGTALITVLLAKAGFRYYALVIRSIMTAVCSFIWNYASTKPKFHFRIKMDPIKKVIGFSGYQFAFNVVNYLSRNLDNLLTGKFMGSAELGYYNKAYNLMLYPVNNLTGVISPVLHPILSEYQKQLDEIYKKYIKIIKLLACFGLYIAPVCFLASNEMISILYGDNWKRTVICFQLLSVAIVPQMINSSAGAIFQAIGNTKLLFQNSCINTTITIVAILIGVFVGKNIEVLSLCVAIAYIFHFFSAFTMLITMGFGYPLQKFIKDMFQEICIFAVMVVAVVLYPFTISNLFASAVVKCCYLAVVYVLSLIASGEYRLFLSLIKK